MATVPLFMAEEVSIFRASIWKVVGFALFGCVNKTLLGRSLKHFTVLLLGPTPSYFFHRKGWKRQGMARREELLRLIIDGEGFGLGGYHLRFLPETPKCALFVRSTFMPLPN